ncbi:MAG: hypothetical protein Q8O82_12015 [Pseudorhodobacter sp.]|nr:hypothetical protein [Pseudorhodobacter sp.]
MTKLDNHETKTAFAARVGLTKGRISQLMAEGLPVRADGQIDVAEGLAWIEDNLDPSRRNKGGVAAAPARVSTTLAEAKRLHEIVKVQRAKLAFEREQGQLVETVAATPAPRDLVSAPASRAGCCARWRLRRRCRRPSRGSLGEAQSL